MRAHPGIVWIVLSGALTWGACGGSGGETADGDASAPGDAEVVGPGDTEDVAPDASDDVDGDTADGGDGGDAADGDTSPDDARPDTSEDTVEDDVPFLILEEPFEPPSVELAPVDEGGGIILLDDGAMLLVPEGALAEPVLIAVFRTDEPPPAGYTIHSAVYRFEPAGLTFLEPVRVRLPYRGGLEAPVVYWSSADGEGFDRIEQVTTTGTFVEVEVTHFSRGFVGDSRIGCMGSASDVRRHCGEGAECVDGGCVLTGTTTRCSRCDTACRALASDPDACGACGSGCVEGTSCVSGACVGGSSPSDGFARGPMPCRINFRYAWADDLQTTVLDEVTGLVWQRGVHPNTPEPPTWAEALAYCEGLTLDGHEDWRLPTRVELATIDGHSVDFPLEAPFFPTPTSALWTASTAGPDRAWLLDFPTGTSLRAVGSRTNTGARCVRGPASGTPARQPLEVTAQVVRDPNTGLVWQRQLNPARSLLGAQATCGNLVLDGASDWAVATTYELQTLVDERREPAVDLRHFPELAHGPEVWSRTLELGVSWTVSFAQGTVQRRVVADQQLPFLCVRRAAPALGCKVCEPECQNGGLCEEQGFCACGWTGYSGDRCEVPICSSGCPNGGFCTAPDTCTCPAGRGGPSCAVCPAGTSSTGTDTVCRPCQPGTFSAAAGASSCTACPCGEVAPAQGMSACQSCGPSAAAQPGESACTVCGPGTLAPIGSCACGEPCAAGSEVTADRATCEACDAGEYSEPGGVCKPCTAYDPSIGCTVVDECALGVADCDARATCTDTLGGYTCRCPPGTIDVNGDGTECATPVGGGLAIGDNHSCAVDVAGRLFCWGDNRGGQLGLGGTFGSGPLFRANPTRIGADTRWLAVAAGANHTCAIRADSVVAGSLHCWGRNIDGALGLGDVSITFSPTQVGDGSDWTGVAAARNSTCGIRSGVAYCWGNNDSGQVGPGPSGGTVRTPRRVVGMGDDWGAITVGGYGACGLRGGALYCWGEGNGSGGQIGTATDWSEVSRGGFHTCGRRGGRLFCWGANQQGQLGVGDQLSRSAPTQVGAATDWSQVELGLKHTCGRRGDRLYCWGENATGQLGLGHDASVASPVLVGPGWTDVAAGTQHTCGLREDRLHCWGQERHGQLGLGFAGGPSSPTRVGGESDWSEVVASERATCGRRNGALFCWGSNAHGWLGAPPAPARATPMAIATPASNDWSQLSAGRQHVCGIKGGALYCWGRNVWGELGVGDTSDRTQPTRVGSATDWAEVAAGWSQTCGRRGGALYCWGYRQSGDDGSQGVREPLPVRVGQDNDWTALSGRGLYACGLRGGALYCWGVLTGIAGTPSNSAVPIRIGEQIGWTAVSAGNGHACGIRNGGLYCWGVEYRGRLGLGLPDHAVVPAPTRVGTNADWSGIDARDHNTCGRRGGRLFCWGSNGFGQLGLGHREPRDTPTRIGLLQDWSEVAVGQSHTCARRGGQLYCWGLGDEGQLGIGDTWSPQPVVSAP